MQMSIDITEKEATEAIRLQTRRLIEQGYFNEQERQTHLKESYLTRLDKCETMQEIDALYMEIQER